MDAAQAFRFGFLARCAEEGLSPAETLDRARSGLAFAKRAGIGNAAGALAGMAMSGIKGTPHVAATLFPWILGAGGVTAAALGAAAAKAQDADFDPDEAKRQELIDTLNFHTNQLHRRQLLRQHQAALPHMRRHA